MDQHVFDYLDHLATKPMTLPLPARRRWNTPDFEPEHMKCHLTAMQMACETGFPIVPGVLFIERAGKLAPWGHMVNRSPTGLVDLSPLINERRLGFAEMEWSELQRWREIVGQLDFLLPDIDDPRYRDERAQTLSDRHLTRLRGLYLDPRFPPPLPPHPVIRP